MTLLNTSAPPLFAVCSKAAKRRKAGLRFILAPGGSGPPLLLSSISVACFSRRQHHPQLQLHGPFAWLGNHDQPQGSKPHFLQGLLLSFRGTQHTTAAPSKDDQGRVGALPESDGPMYDLYQAITKVWDSE